MTTASIHWLTGAEPAPIIRHRNAGRLADILDTVMCAGDEILAAHLPKDTGFGCYRLYSIALFYRDGEQHPEEYAGFIAAYTSLVSGKPAIHMYCWEQYVCWNGKDSQVADMLRVASGLRRYLLFLRRSTSKQPHVYAWEFHHAGQLPIYQMEKT